jgi:transcriptional regulator with XRE-family HTH domain
MPINSETMVIGSRIKQLREVQGMTQHDLAEKLQVNRSMVAKYEADASMTLATLLDLCRILNTHPDYFLGFSDSRHVKEGDDISTLGNKLERDLIANMLEQIKTKDEEIKLLRRERTKNKV